MVRGISSRGTVTFTNPFYASVDLESYLDEGRFSLRRRRVGLDQNLFVVYLMIKSPA